LQDGGTLAYFNNFIHSSENRNFAPYIKVETGGALDIVPDKPKVKIEPDPSHSHLATGAIKITIQPDDKVFCWRVKLNGKQVDRWQVKHPKKGEVVTFALEDLKPSEKYDVEVIAVSKSGQTSEAVSKSVTSSDKLSQKIQLGTINKPGAGSAPRAQDGKMRVWALPGLIKVSPEKPAAMYRDMGADAPAENSNAVWDGKGVSLFGIRGEYVDFQLCIEKLGANLTNVKVNPVPLKGPGDTEIGGTELELFKNWYSKTKEKKWQPAYPIPLKHGEAFEIPDSKRGIGNQQNQTVYVDVYIPKDAKRGVYKGSFEISADGVAAVSIPVSVKVHDFLMPDELAFWPEMNAYKVPRDAHDYWRLAHQHRCVANFWRFQPRLNGSGKNIKVDWDRYDKAVGPLLSGEAFKNNRRAGHPTEVMYLPFEDSWPSRLTKQNYNYQGHWPGRGENKKHLVDHVLTSPYIGDALSQDYKDAFLEVQRQFVEHFKEKGWNKTEMQCFFGGKKTHRIDWGSNMWWTTDEPYHWDDWLALQFFDRLWTEGRKKLGASRKIWAARADISRPNWKGRIMDGILDTDYYGGFNNPRWYRRCRIVEEDTGCKTCSYGSANAHNRSNTETVVLCLNMWLNGSNAHLPWQTCGNERALDKQESCGGNALFVPGKKFGLKVVGDMRLKAFRQGEQIIEYLVMVQKKYKLNREQLKAMVFRAVEIKTDRIKGSGLDNADALKFSAMKGWQIAELRRTLIELLEK
jgi:hypothetical protein